MRILLVEDEPLISAMLVQWVRDLGHEPCGTASTVLGALKHLEDSSPDCALVDVSVGDGLCYPVARALQDRKIPFLFTTGYFESEIDPEFAEIPVAS